MLRKQREVPLWTQLERGLHKPFTKTWLEEALGLIFVHLPHNDA